MKKLTISIVSYNNRDVLKNCLESILINLGEIDCEIFVVDNNSKDKTLEMIKSKFPQINLITNKQNLGFSAAHNQAYLKSVGQYILVLNPDVIVQGNSISTLMNFMDNCLDAGIACPMLRNADGSLQYSCRTFYSIRSILLRRTFLGKIFGDHSILKKHLMSDWDHENIATVDWAIGASLMIRREALEKNKVFDEKFFMYFEDVDLCYRMKCQNYKVYYVPTAVMIHQHVRESSKGIYNRAKYEHLKSFLNFCIKYKGILQPKEH
jgi:GT2 family glycosyltransferase